MIGKTILNYTITKELGEGGMAKVYVAKHVKINKEVAIKVLNPALSTDDSLKSRFMQEANVMAKLEHENIARVLDYNEDSTALAIVMDLYKGDTLDEYIKQKKSLSTSEIKNLFTQIVGAFEYAHSKGVVHRDVKPSNIFITTEGKVKILDFGIAKLIEDNSSMKTQTGMQMGTPAFMSPEQVNDAKNVDRRTDIYSLGVVLWYMAMGRNLYDTNTDSTFTIFKKIDQEVLPTVVQDASINNVIQKATKKKVGDRYSNVRDMLSDLNVSTAGASAPPPPIATNNATPPKPAGDETLLMNPPKPKVKKERKFLKALLYLMLTATIMGTLYLVFLFLIPVILIAVGIDDIYFTGFFNDYNPVNEFFWWIAPILTSLLSFFVCRPFIRRGGLLVLLPFILAVVGMQGWAWYIADKSFIFDNWIIYPVITAFLVMFDTFMFIFFFRKKKN